MQIHYQRLGNRPEILRYTVETAAAGKYELTLNVSTVSEKYEVIARLNRRTLVNTMLPYTKGSWQRTEPEIIELREGRNTIMLTFRAPNRGVSIKELQLKPVK
jgi:SHS2 domain-containing protein